MRIVCEFLLNNLVYPDSVLNNNSVLNALNSHSGAYNQNLDKVLSNTNQKPTSPYIWLKVMECIRKCVPLYDYKACRDIFKMLVELVKRIPHSSSSFPPPLESEKSLSETRASIKKSNEENRVQIVSSRNEGEGKDLRLNSLYEVCLIYSNLVGRQKHRLIDLFFY